MRIQARFGDTDVNACEIYMHRLKMLADEMEANFHRTMNTAHDASKMLHQIKLMRDEIALMEHCIWIYDSITGGRGVVVYAWQEGTPRHLPMRFGSMEVAIEVTGIARRSIQHLVSGTRKRIKGWKMKRYTFEQDVGVKRMDYKNPWKMKHPFRSENL